MYINTSVNTSTQSQKKINLHIQYLEFKNGMYQGQVLQSNERNGLGIYIWDTGEAYYGEWKHDQMEGEGLLFFPYGGYIQGFFFKNQLSGPAFFKFSNNDIYEGFWHHGKLDGNCYKYFAKENEWVLCEYRDGVFKNLIQQGNGLPPSYVFNYITSPFEISERYKQSMENEKVKIKSIQFNDGGQYLGLLSKSHPNGLGIFKYSDGKFDSGLYENGNLSGLGRLNMHNNDIYDGNFVSGQFNGKGIFYQKNQQNWIYGEFQNNECVKIYGKNQGIFPVDKIEQIRQEYHVRSKYFIDHITQNDVFQNPIYHMDEFGEGGNIQLKFQEPKKNVKDIFQLQRNAPDLFSEDALNQKDHQQLSSFRPVLQENELDECFENNIRAEKQTEVNNINDDANRSEQNNQNNGIQNYQQVGQPSQEKKLSQQIQEILKKQPNQLKEQLLRGTRKTQFFSKKDAKSNNKQPKIDSELHQQRSSKSLDKIQKKPSGTINGEQLNNQKSPDQLNDSYKSDIITSQKNDDLNAVETYRVARNKSDHALSNKQLGNQNYQQQNTEKPSNFDQTQQQQHEDQGGEEENASFNMDMSLHGQMEENFQREAHAGNIPESEQDLGTVEDAQITENTQQQPVNTFSYNITATQETLPDQPQDSAYYIQQSYQQQLQQQQQPLIQETQQFEQNQSDLQKKQPPVKISMIQKIQQQMQKFAKGQMSKVNERASVPQQKTPSKQQQQRVSQVSDKTSKEQINKKKSPQQNLSSNSLKQKAKQSEVAKVKVSGKVYQQVSGALKTQGSNERLSTTNKQKIQQQTPVRQNILTKKPNTSAKVIKSSNQVAKIQQIQGLGNIFQSNNQQLKDEDIGVAEQLISPQIINTNESPHSSKSNSDSGSERGRQRQLKNQQMIQNQQKIQTQPQKPVVKSQQQKQKANDLSIEQVKNNKKVLSAEVKRVSPKNQIASTKNQLKPCQDNRLQDVQLYSASQNNLVKQGQAPLETQQQKQQLQGEEDNNKKDLGQLSLLQNMKKIEQTLNQKVKEEQIQRSSSRDVTMASTDKNNNGNVNSNSDSLELKYEPMEHVGTGPGANETPKFEQKLKDLSVPSTDIQAAAGSNFKLPQRKEGNQSENISSNRQLPQGFQQVLEQEEEEDDNNINNQEEIDEQEPQTNQPQERVKRSKMNKGRSDDDDENQASENDQQQQSQIQVNQKKTPQQLKAQSNQQSQVKTRTSLSSGKQPASKDQQKKKAQPDSLEKAKVGQKSQPQDKSAKKEASQVHNSKQKDVKTSNSKVNTSTSNRPSTQGQGRISKTLNTSNSQKQQAAIQKASTKTNASKLQQQPLQNEAEIGQDQIEQQYENDNEEEKQIQENQVESSEEAQYQNQDEINQQLQAQPQQQQQQQFEYFVIQEEDQQPSPSPILPRSQANKTFAFQQKQANQKQRQLQQPTDGQQQFTLRQKEQIQLISEQNNSGNPAMEEDLSLSLEYQQNNTAIPNQQQQSAKQRDSFAPTKEQKLQEKKSNQDQQKQVEQLKKARSPVNKGVQNSSLNTASSLTSPKVNQVNEGTSGKIDVKPTTPARTQNQKQQKSPAIQSKVEKESKIRSKTHQVDNQEQQQQVEEDLSLSLEFTQNQLSSSNNLRQSTGPINVQLQKTPQQSQLLQSNVVSENQKSQALSPSHLNNQDNKLSQEITSSQQSNDYSLPMRTSLNLAKQKAGPVNEQKNMRQSLTNQNVRQSNTPSPGSQQRKQQQMVMNQQGVNQKSQTQIQQKDQTAQPKLNPNTLEADFSLLLNMSQSPEVQQQSQEAFAQFNEEGQLQQQQQQQQELPQQTQSQTNVKNNPSSNNMRSSVTSTPKTKLKEQSLRGSMTPNQKLQQQQTANQKQKSMKGLLNQISDNSQEQINTEQLQDIIDDQYQASAQQQQQQEQSQQLSQQPPTNDVIKSSQIQTPKSAQSIRKSQQGLQNQLKASPPSNNQSQQLRKSNYQSPQNNSIQQQKSLRSSVTPSPANKASKNIKQEKEDEIVLKDQESENQQQKQQLNNQKQSKNIFQSSTSITPKEYKQKAASQNDQKNEEKMYNQAQPEEEQAVQPPEDTATVTTPASINKNNTGRISNISPKTNQISQKTISSSTTAGGKSPAQQNLRKSGVPGQITKVKTSSVNDDDLKKLQKQQQNDGKIMSGSDNDFTSILLQQQQAQQEIEDQGELQTGDQIVEIRNSQNQQKQTMEVRKSQSPKINSNSSKISGTPNPNPNPNQSKNIQNISQTPKSNNPKQNLRDSQVGKSPKSPSVQKQQQQAQPASEQTQQEQNTPQNLKQSATPTQNLRKSMKTPIKLHQVPIDQATPENVSQQTQQLDQQQAIQVSETAQSSLRQSQHSISSKKPPTIVALQNQRASSQSPSSNLKQKDSSAIKGQEASHKKDVSPKTQQIPTDLKKGVASGKSPKVDQDQLRKSKNPQNQLDQQQKEDEGFEIEMNLNQQQTDDLDNKQHGFYCQSVLQDDINDNQQQQQQLQKANIFNSQDGKKRDNSPIDKLMEQLAQQQNKTGKLMQIKEEKSSLELEKSQNQQNEDNDYQQPRNISRSPQRNSMKTKTQVVSAFSKLRDSINPSQNKIPDQQQQQQQHDQREKSSSPPGSRRSKKFNTVAVLNDNNLHQQEQFQSPRIVDLQVIDQIIAKKGTPKLLESVYNQQLQQQLDAEQQQKRSPNPRNQSPSSAQKKRVSVRICEQTKNNEVSNTSKSPPQRSSTQNQPQKQALVNKTQVGNPESEKRIQGKKVDDKSTPATEVEFEMAIDLNMNEQGREFIQQKEVKSNFEQEQEHNQQKQPPQYQSQNSTGFQTPYLLPNNQSQNTDNITIRDRIQPQQITVNPNTTNQENLVSTNKNNVESNPLLGQPFFQLQQQKQTQNAGNQQIDPFAYKQLSELTQQTYNNNQKMESHSQNKDYQQLAQPIAQKQQHDYSQFDNIQRQNNNAKEQPINEQYQYNPSSNINTNKSFHNTQEVLNSVKELQEQVQNEIYILESARNNFLKQSINHPILQTQYVSNTERNGCSNNAINTINQHSIPANIYQYHPQQLQQPSSNNVLINNNYGNLVDTFKQSPVQNEYLSPNNYKNLPKTEQIKTFSMPNNLLSPHYQQNPQVNIYQNLQNQQTPQNTWVVHPQTIYTSMERSPGRLNVYKMDQSQESQHVVSQYASLIKPRQSPTQQNKNAFINTNFINQSALNQLQQQNNLSDIDKSNHQLTQMLSSKIRMQTPSPSPRKRLLLNLLPKQRAQSVAAVRTKIITDNGKTTVQCSPARKIITIQSPSSSSVNNSVTYLADSPIRTIIQHRAVSPTVFYSRVSNSSSIIQPQQQSMTISQVQISPPQKKIILGIQKVTNKNDDGNETRNQEQSENEKKEQEKLKEVKEEESDEEEEIKLREQNNQSKSKPGDVVVVDEACNIF